MPLPTPAALDAADVHLGVAYEHLQVLRESVLGHMPPAAERSRDCAVCALLEAVQCLTLPEPAPPVRPGACAGECRGLAPRQQREETHP